MITNHRIIIHYILDIRFYISLCIVSVQCCTRECKGMITACCLSQIVRHLKLNLVLNYWIIVRTKISEYYYLWVSEELSA